MTRGEPMKKCTACGKEKEFQAFFKRGNGYLSACRDCAAERKRAWAQKNKSKIAEYQRQYRAEDREAHRARAAKWAADNKAKVSAQQARWRESNPDAVRAQKVARRARKLHAKPPWFGELDELVMREAADLAARRASITGFSWQIDHIIPLQGVTVCGLHVGNNVQVIPATANRAKSNKFEAASA
jgi:hypothetical protein